MITLSLLFLVAAIVFLGFWISGFVVSFIGLAKILFFVCLGLFVLLCGIGVLSKPPKV